MNIPNLSGLVGVIKTFAMANRPEILLGAAVTATLGSTVLAAKGGYEARGIIDHHRIMSGTEPDLKTKVQLTWLCYIPATIACTTAIGSTAGLHLVHVKDKKALATAGMAAIEELKSEMASLEKEKRELENSPEVLEARADEDGKVHVQNTDGIVEELYLVRDGRSGRDIFSNEARIADAVNQVNKVLAKQGDCELNTFYGAAGFELLFPEGDDWGWSGDELEIKWKGEIRDDGRPVRRFDFKSKPKEGFLSSN